MNDTERAGVNELVNKLNIKEERIVDLEKENAKLEGKLADLTSEYYELEKEISVLLSCKNCPDNKGGYICQKEYEDKCLAQKIQYIKELENEIVFQKIPRGTQGVF